MKQHKHILQWVTRLADVEKVTLPRLPLVEIVGTNRVLIENYQGVHSYDPMEIQVCVKEGKIVICGSCMKLSCMTKSQLLISGNIDCVQLRKRGD